VVADGLHDRMDAAVAHAEPFARHAADVGLAARCAVECDVADDDVVFSRKRSFRLNPDDDLAARQALAHVVVGIAFEVERDAARQERAEALPCGPLEVESDGVVRQAVRAVPLRDLAAEQRAGYPVGVADRQGGLDRFPALQCGPAERHEHARV